MPAVILRPGEGERHSMGPSEILIKAASDDTGGTFFMSESTIAPGFPGPPLHRHRELHDMFYVLEGTLTVRVEEETHELGAGSFVCVPPGVAHTFSNPGGEPVRILNLNTPGGWERYMRDLAEASARGEISSPADIGRIAARHDFEAVAE